MCLRLKIKKSRFDVDNKDGSGRDRNEICFYLSLYLCITDPSKNRLSALTRWYRL